MNTLPFLSEQATDQWFLEKYTNLFPKPSSLPLVSPFHRARKKFVIAFTARVGSTLWCQHLFPYGVFVAEFFNPLHLQAGSHIQEATDYHDLCARLVDDYAVNGVWGVKAHVQSMIPLFLVEEFPLRLDSWRFVYITRDNIVRQAISQVIAKKRQSYSSWIEPTRELSDDDYCGQDITDAIFLTRLEQNAWETFFETFRVTPLRLTYEQIVADPEAIAARVAEHCGLERGGADLVEPFNDPPLSPQTTALNSLWERRFISERGSDANRP